MVQDNDSSDWNMQFQNQNGALSRIDLSCLFHALLEQQRELQQEH
jgi:hypothetical protein